MGACHSVMAAHLNMNPKLRSPGPQGKHLPLTGTLLWSNPASLTCQQLGRQGSAKIPGISLKSFRFHLLQHLFLMHCRYSRHTCNVSIVAHWFSNYPSYTMAPWPLRNAHFGPSLACVALSSKLPCQALFTFLLLTQSFLTSCLCFVSTFLPITGHQRPALQHTHHPPAPLVHVPLLLSFFPQRCQPCNHGLQA